MNPADDGRTYDPAELTALREQLARLQRRIDALEDGRGRAPAPAAATKSPEPPLATEELLAIISAALAAHLGVKPHIRQVRLLGGATWAQVGRVTIQASHILQIR
jgi:methylmalonyl-CoA carboxyltransferase large subunit